MAVQSALRLKPTFTDAYNNMASALVQKGLIPAALQCYQSALQINPNLVRHTLQAPKLKSMIHRAASRHSSWHFSSALIVPLSGIMSLLLLAFQCLPNIVH